MSCPELMRTQAYLDGELDVKTAAEAEHHMETCADCREFSTAVATLSESLQSESLRTRAPDALRKRIGAALDAESMTKISFGFTRDPRSFWFGAAAGAGISAIAAIVAFLMVLPPSASSLGQWVTDAHTRALMSGETIEVISESRHTVKPWFAGRVPVSPPVADFTEQGYALLGGRVDRIGRVPAAVLVYRHGKHQIDLFVWADHGSELPREGTRHGYHSIFWKNDDLNFAAVSDTESGELKKFVALIRSEVE